MRLSSCRTTIRAPIVAKASASMARKTNSNPSVTGPGVLAAAFAKNQTATMVVAPISVNSHNAPTSSRLRPGTRSVVCRTVMGDSRSQDRALSGPARYASACRPSRCHPHADCPGTGHG